MPPLKPGWYCYTAPNGTDRCATDRQGPFATRKDVVDWITEHGLQYLPNAEAYARAVLHAGEMTGQESGRPWATAIHKARA